MSTNHDTADWAIFGDDLPEPRFDETEEDPHRYDREQNYDEPSDMQRLAGEIFLFDGENPFDTIFGFFFGG